MRRLVFLLGVLTSCAAARPPTTPPAPALVAGAEQTAARPWRTVLEPFAITELADDVVLSEANRG